MGATVGATDVVDRFPSDRAEIDRSLDSRIVMSSRVLTSSTFSLRFCILPRRMLL